MGTCLFLPARRQVAVRLTAALALLVPALVAVGLTPPSPARAVKATGGEGRFVDSIEWIRWGTNNQQIPRSGVTRTETFRVGSATVAVTCTVGPITGDGTNPFPLEAYRSGNWGGDALDQLYNVGGPDGANTLVNGLSNRTHGVALSFDLSCSATLDGRPLPLAGLVMADAEQSGGGIEGEYVQATIPPGAEWRLIDRYRSPGCSASSIARRTDQTLRLAGAGAICPVGPSVVAFMDGASSATNVTVRGGGKSAIALGVAIDLDYSDAPASYGVAGHALQRTYTGGVVPQGTTTTVSNDTFALAEPGVPALRLGPSVDGEADALSGPDALGDDTDGAPAFGGPDDEDAATFPAPRAEVFPGSTFSQQVRCTASQSVAGWVDWNADGRYGDGERSGTAVCAGGTVTLTWQVPGTIPAGDVRTFARIRSAADPDPIATPTGIAPNGEVEDHAVTVRRPAVSIDKRAALEDLDGNGPDAGDRISYALSVANEGTVPLDPVVVRDPLLGGVVPCGEGPLAGGDSRRCAERAYTITQPDVEAGEVVNTATVTGTPPRGADVSADDTVTVPIPSRPGLTVDKTAGAVRDVDGNGPDAGDPITYSFTVTNTGNRPLTDVAVSDPQLGPVRCAPTSLAPGGVATCDDVAYTLTQADLQAGGVVNTATATATTPSGGTVSDEDSTSTPVPRRPGLRLDKTAGPVQDADGNGLVGTGDSVAYTFEVTNTGNVTVAGLAVADPKVGRVECPTAPLAPARTATCTASYEITQADVDAGRVDNVATASAVAPGDTVVRSNQDATSTATDSLPSLALQKRAAGTGDVNGNAVLDAGDTVTYEYVVRNDGTVTVSGIAIDDPRTNGANCPTTTLAPGERTTCAKTYQVTQADVDSGRVRNTATATGSDPGGDPVRSPEAVVVTPTADGAALVIDKRVAEVEDRNLDGTVDAGDTIRYEFVVRNSGHVTVSGVRVDDPKVGATCPVPALAPGRSTTCVASYTVTQPEVNAGRVENTATATGADPGGDPVVSDPDSTLTTTASDASLHLEKSAGTPADRNANGLVDAGDTIAYEFVVENTGSVTVESVAVEDPKVGAVACPGDSLDPTEAVTCTAVYEITQADVDGGSVDNVAAATGTAGGDPVRSDQAATSTPTDFVAALDLRKSVAATHDVDGNRLLDAGDTIDYEFLVTNTGTVTTTFVGVDDPRTVSADCPRTTLRPGQGVTCRQTYQVTQADVDAGSVPNTANATAEDPRGEQVRSEPSSTTTATDSIAALRIDKDAADTHDVDGDGRFEAGDTIDYTFVVANSGTVTLAGVRVVDDLVGTVACPRTDLAAGGRMTCTATYELTQAAVDSGTVDNVAHAEGTTPGGKPVRSAEDATSTALDAQPALAFDKIAGVVADVDGDGRNSLGDTIDYEFVVHNTGTVTVVGLQIVDPRIGRAACPATTLAPTETVTCSATYRLGQADLDAGVVRNTAHAAGRTPGGDPVRSPQDTTTTPVPAESAIGLAKTAELLDGDGDDRADAGERVRYRFRLTNTGATTLRDVEVQDAMLDRADVEVRCPRDTLAPGATMTCRAVYQVTDADLGAALVNTATVSGLGPDGVVAGSDPSTARVATARPAGPAQPGGGADGGGDGGADDVDGILPDAGGPALWGVLLGALLLLAGAGVLLLARRRT